jgi:hypothetical protein
VVPLVKAVQELSQENDQLKQRIEKLESLVNAPASNDAQQTISLSSAFLKQNNPNPFVAATVIEYMLPGKYTSAKISVTDNRGMLLKEMAVTGSGQGSITVDASGLASGTYNYSLYVDGKLVAWKQMVLAR